MLYAVLVQNYWFIRSRTVNSIHKFYNPFNINTVRCQFVTTEARINSNHNIETWYNVRD